MNIVPRRGHSVTFLVAKVGMHQSGEIQYVLQSRDFQKLPDSLINRGYQVLGPTVRDGAIVYDELTSTSDLPVGWTDEQNGGTYRLKKRDDQAMFGYAVGPHSWKRFLPPPVVRLWQAIQDKNGLQITEDPPDGERTEHVRDLRISAAAVAQAVGLRHHAGRVAPIDDVQIRHGHVGARVVFFVRQLAGLVALVDGWRLAL